MEEVRRVAMFGAAVIIGTKNDGIKGIPLQNEILENPIIHEMRPEFIAWMTNTIKVLN